MTRNARAMTAGKGWRAWVARLLSVAVLLAALLVPPIAEADTTVAPFLVAAISQPDSTSDTPSRPHKMAHAGTHCACQLAIRMTSPEPVGPTTLNLLIHSAQTVRALASLEAEPPARPPRA